MFWCRTVIDIHFLSIRSLTFYRSIPIISIRFWRTALIEYVHMFLTIFVARILRFLQCKDNEGFLNTFWLNTWVSQKWLKMAKNGKGVKGSKMCFESIDITIDIIFYSINWENNFDRSILVILMTVLFWCLTAHLHLGCTYGQTALILKHQVNITHNYMRV